MSDHVTWRDGLLLMRSTGTHTCIFPKPKWCTLQGYHDFHLASDLMVWHQHFWIYHYSAHLSISIIVFSQRALHWKIRHNLGISWHPGKAEHQTTWSDVAVSVLKKSTLKWPATIFAIFKLITNSCNTGNEAT